MKLLHPDYAFLNRLVLYVLLLGGGLSLPFPESVNAESVNAEEVYVVNIQEVVAKSNAGSVVRKKVEGEALKKRARIERLSQEAESFEQKLQKQASILSQAALQAKQDQLIQMKRELARTVQDEQEYLQRESGKAVTKLVEKIQEILPAVVEDQLGKKSGTGKGAIIIERDPQLVMYVSPDFDITEKVIESLNKTAVNF